MRGWPVADERTTAADGTDADDGSLASIPRPIFATVLPLATWLLLSVVVVALHASAFDRLSAFDEGVHFDYVVSASHGTIVRKGDVIGAEAMRASACRGIDTPGLRMPPCRGPHDPSDFPVEGANYADIHPPPYYFVTAGVSALIRSVGLTDDLVTAGRLAGVLWLWLGLTLVWYAGRELRVPRTPLAIAVILLAVSPPVIHASATVNNDATALPAGAAVVLLLLLWERGRAPLWAFGVVTFASPAFKSTNAIVIGAALLYMAIRAATHHEREARLRYIPAAVTALVTTFVAVIGWGVVHDALALPVTNPLDDLFAARHLSLETHVLPNVSAFLTILQTKHISLFDERAIRGLLLLTNGLVVAAAFQHLLAGELATRGGAIAAAGGLAMLAGGTVILLVNFFFLGFLFDVQPRYGLSLLPLLFVVLASSMRWRAMTWLLGALTAVMVTLVTLTMVRAL